jgi:hypothetical protein
MLGFLIPLNTTPYEPIKMRIIEILYNLPLPISLCIKNSLLSSSNLQGIKLA